MFWPLVQVVNFRFAPAHTRTAFVASASFFWCIILSYFKSVDVCEYLMCHICCLSITITCIFCTLHNLSAAAWHTTVEVDTLISDYYWLLIIDIEPGEFKWLLIDNIPQYLFWLLIWQQVRDNVHSTPCTIYLQYLHLGVPPPEKLPIE